MRRMQNVCLAGLMLGLTSLASAQIDSTVRAIGVDTAKAAIPLEEVSSGGPPPQGIPALGFSGDRAGAAGPSPAPKYVAQTAAAWLGAEEPVIAVTLGGESRAYPLQILTWHEIVNDTLGGVPVAVTFCPLCNSALAFDRRVPLTNDTLEELRELTPELVTTDPGEAFRRAYGLQTADAELVAGLEVTFGVSGLLYNSNLLMFDSESRTLWSQLVGEGAVGALTGAALLRYPAQIVSFADFRKAFPAGSVLSRETGFSRDYGANPYVGYDRADTPPFLFSGETDGRLPPKTRVVTLGRGGEAAAYPFDVLASVGVVNDDVGGEPLAFFWQPGTRSALDAGAIAKGEDVGAVGVFSRTLDSVTLTFVREGAVFKDAETGSSWNLLGQAVAGKLKGEQLVAVPHDNTLWFAWAAFRPDTRIYGAADDGS